VLTVTKYDFYVNALESMARSKSELASEGKNFKETIRHVRWKRGREDSDEEGGEDQDPSGEEEGNHIRKMSLSKSQGAKLAAEIQTTTKTSVNKQMSSQRRQTKAKATAKVMKKA
jgi:hypothetical protein